MGDNIKVERVGWLSFVQRRDKSRAVVNAGIKFPVYRIWGIF
jgi:hypothetical protein